MGIIQLINTEAAEQRRSIAFAGAMAGVANTAVIACANAAAKEPETLSLRLFGMFLLSVALFILCYRYSARRMTIIFEDVLLKVKLRVTDKIRRMEMQGLDRIGTAEIFDRVTENMTVISDSAGIVAHLLRSACMVVFGALYMMYVSLPAFALSSALFAIAIVMYMSTRGEITGHLKDAAQSRLAFFDMLTDLLQGFKEVKFSRKRSDELQADTAKVAAITRASTLKANLLLEDNQIIPTLNIFSLLGAIAFLLPRYVPAHAETVGVLIALAMFIFNPIAAVVGSAPVYIRANLALENIEKLEQKLDENMSVAEVDAEDPWGGKLTSIEADRVKFSYMADDSDKPFHIGPVSLTIPAGEIFFIVGGNGSGKSTLLKVLTGIYPPSTGTLKVNNLAVNPENVQAYREMISAIFSDFHLFKKLYGLAGVSDESVHQLLTMMELERKTSFVDQRFTAINLSTGQRKRLAFIVTMLEDRPVYAFDEWAADQDPDFRKYFYEELIQDLKRRGKTVLVVSHDDRYFHCADRVAVMEYGKLRSIEAQKGRPEATL